MKIFLDCTFLKNTHTGVDVSTLKLIENLFKIGSEHNFTILINSRYNEERLLQAIGEYTNYKLKKIYTRLPLQAFYSGCIIPFYLRLNRYDVYHNPFFFGPVFRSVCQRTKVIITVHDLYHKKVPEMMGKYLATIFNLFADRAIKKADEIIVISEQTKEDVKKYFRIDNSKLNLIHQALNSSIEDVIENENVFKKNKIQKGKYILTVGTVMPSKGLDDLIRSYAYFKEKNPFEDIKLVSVGMHVGTFINNIKNLLKNLNLENDNVKILGYVDNSTLKSLYKNARIFVLPSHHEGFGLPLLEAMKFRIPIIARNIPSLREIANESAFFFTDVEDLTEKIMDIYTNKTTADNLVKRGLERLNDFSWQSTAQKTLFLYKK